MKRQQYISGWVILSMSITSVGWAETQAAPGTFQNPNSVQNNLPQDNVTGLENKLNDAGGQSNSGQGAAIGSGIALTVQAITAFALGDWASGSSLMSMAGTEFGQAGADSGTQSANYGGEGTLRTDTSPTGSQSAYNPSSVANQLLSNPATAATLSNMGVNPEDFVNALTSGNMTSPEQVANALSSGSLTEDQIAAISSAPNALEDTADPAAATMAMENGATSGAAGGPFASGSGTGTGTGSGTGTNNGPSSTTAHDANSRGVAQSGSSGSGSGSDRGPASTDPLAGFDPNGGMLANGKSGAFGSDMDAMELARLKALGILKTRGKQTIFQIASRQYRSFKGWRRSLRVVQTGTAGKVATTKY